MYDWKDIALMYKEEANRLNDEIYWAFENLGERLPHSIKKASGVLQNAIVGSSENLNFIESFEKYADKVKKTEKTFDKKIISEIKSEIKSEKKSEKKYGAFINSKDFLKEEDYLNVEAFCSDIHDIKKKPYQIMDKCATLATINWLKERGFSVLVEDLSRLKNNIITVLDKKGRERKVKVVASALEFSGKTRPFGSKEDFCNVEKQYTYLIDPKENFSDVYVFANFNSMKKNLSLYAWVKGEYISEMMVDPLRERFIGKKACILQKRGYNSPNRYPFSINEMIKRS